VLTKTGNHKAYEYFKNWFDDLWFNAMANVRAEDVHPRWRKRREEILKERWHVAGVALRSSM
jgi:hypothetical protein